MRISLAVIYALLIGLQGFCQVWGQEPRGPDEELLFVNRVIRNRPLMMNPWRAYESYAFKDYKNYDNFFYPYTSSQRGYYGPLGNFLINGYEVYKWTERRGSPTEGVSSVSAPGGRLLDVFNGVVVGSDAYNSWSAKLSFAGIMGIKFTPLTLDVTDHRGIRLDVSTANNGFTGYFSRVGGDQAMGRDEIGSGSTRVGLIRLGGHYERKIGLMDVGVTHVNQFVYDALRDDNGLKGVLRPEQVLPSLLAIRFLDDSPRDGRGGPMVYDANIYVNGKKRDDLVPFILKGNRKDVTVVGRRNRVTGQFQRSGYPVFIPYAGWSGDLYRDKEIPLFADYGYFRDHLDGVDVSQNVDLDLLMSSYERMPKDRSVGVSGDDYLIYYFDLSGEDYVESVEFDAMVADDYRIEISEIDQTKKTKEYEQRYNASFFRTVLRADGNVQNGSNLRRIRLKVGVPTGLWVSGVNVHTNIRGLKVNGEYASAVEFCAPPQGELSSDPEDVAEGSGGGGPRPGI